MILVKVSNLYHGPLLHYIETVLKWSRLYISEVNINFHLQKCIQPVEARSLMNRLIFGQVVDILRLVKTTCQCFSLCQDLHEGAAILEWVGGMYGMNNKYSIEHPLTWKAIQRRQGKIVNTTSFFLIFLTTKLLSKIFFLTPKIWRKS